MEAIAEVIETQAGESMATVPIISHGIWSSFVKGRMHPGLSDEELVFRTRAGSPEAFEELVYRYQDRVFAILLGLVGNHDDALDLAQETFVRAYTRLSGFHGRCAFYTWIYRIAVNLSTDHFRRRSRRPISLEDMGREPHAAPDDLPHRVAEMQELSSVLESAVAALPELLRAPVVLHDVEGLGQDEVATILGCSRGALRSRLFRARSLLRVRLGSYLEDG